MKLDLATLVFILGLTVFTQVIAIFIQYRINKNDLGIGWWLLGSCCIALGFIALALGRVPYIRVLALIGNPLLVFGHLSLLIGTLRFREAKENRRILGALFVIFAITYYYFLLWHADLSARTIIVAAVIMVFGLMTAHNLLFKQKKSVSGSCLFTGSVFLIHSSFLMVLIASTLLTKPVHSYLDYSAIQIAAFIVPTITSTLWTFGFILMVNQRLNAEILEEKENLQQVFNIGPDAALITRLTDGRVVDANSIFSAMSGYSRQELIGKRIRDLGFWRDPADQDRFFADITQKHYCENLESMVQRKDGSELVGLTSARLLTIHDQRHIVSVTRDITKQKQAEEALRVSEETYRSILKASPDDVTITDLEGRILMVSSASYQIFGFTPGEEDGKHILDFVAPEDHERARANILRMYHGGHQRPNEYRGLRKDGSLVDLEVNSGLINGVQGQPVKMVFVVRDVTERKHAEAARTELESKNRQLSKAESLGRMAGAIAHHFNNQLQSVQSNLELLSQAPENADPSKWLADARQAAERAAEVSRLMLAYLGQTSHEQEPRFLAELCRNGLPLIQGLPGKVSVETDLPLPGPVVSVDPSQIQEVISHLITNAWEALGEAKGTIRMSLRTCPVNEISSAHRFPIDWQPQARDYACLEVIDSGCGIADADIEKIFDPFYSTKFIGRGLGLSVVLGVVQTHGGAVTVQSARNRGSVFQVYFPLWTETIPGAAKVGIPASAEPASGTVLLVDDDELLLDATGAILEMEGFTVLMARDGIEALDVFQQHRNQIRCVITDLTMPRMDGWETLTALRALDPTLPVILMSGYDRAHAMSGTHDIRPNAFLGKPFNLKSLLRSLSEALNGTVDGG